MRKEVDLKDSARGELLEKIKRGDRKEEDDRDPSLGMQSVEREYQIAVREGQDDSFELEQLPNEELVKKYRDLQHKFQSYQLQVLAKRGSAQSSQKKLDESGEVLDNSQDANEETFKNINDEIERLTLKCEELSREKQELKKDSDNRLKAEETRAKEYKDKYHSIEEINTSLSKMVLHLEQELAHYKGDVDVSKEVQQGSELHSVGEGNRNI